MKRTAIISAALCLALMASGCAHNGGVQEGKFTDSTVTEITEAESSETETETETSVTQTEIASEETSEEKTVWTFKSSHEVRVETVTLQRLDDGNYIFATLIPKIFVDGKEASEINSFLDEYIQKKYPLKIEGNHADGTSVKFDCGVKDSILSISLLTSATDCDYFSGEVLNFDLDTQKQLDSHEVTKFFGMTDEELFAKVKDIMKDYCKTDEKSYSAYDYEESAALINYDKITPYIMPDGSKGVSVTLIYSEQTQFYGLECQRSFVLEK